MKHPPSPEKPAQPIPEQQAGNQCYTQSYEYQAAGHEIILAQYHLNRRDLGGYPENASRTALQRREY